MKTSCNVIKDMLPLYVENLASNETRRMVDEHISDCVECKKELEDMQSSTMTPMDTNTKPLEKIRDRMKKKRHQTIIFTTMITLIIAVIVIAFLTAPDYLNDPMTVSIEDHSDGTVVAYFHEKVSGYDIEKYYENDGYVYDITTWDSIWRRNFSRTEVNSMVLNAGGENVESVYYYHTNDNLNTLIYGRDQHQNGGSMTLPRLTLSYYLLIAVVVIVICLMGIRIFRKHKKIKNTCTKMMFLPISYIIGHILIKGFTTASYSMTRDFLAIILVMIGVYTAILIGMNIMNKANKRTGTSKK